MVFGWRLRRAISRRNASVQHLLQLHAMGVQVELGEVLTLQEGNGLRVGADVLNLGAKGDLHGAVRADARIRAVRLG